MAYNKTNWQNLPSTNTPISANNLNKIENGIYDNSLKADQVGDLTQLTTTEKSTLVGAINENNSQITNLNTYSTTEQVIGTWIDDKPIYRQCVYVSSFPNATSVIIDLSSSNIDYLIKMYGSAKTVSDNKVYCTPINNARPEATGTPFGAFIDGGNLKIVTAIDRTIYSGYIIIEYTKTTD